MKNLITTLALVLIFTVTGTSQYLIKSSYSDTIALNLPKVQSKFINNKTAIILGYSSLVAGGFFRTMHSMYMLQPELFKEKYGWDDPRDIQNDNIKGGYNSVFSFIKNPDHTLNALGSGFTYMGAACITYNFVDGWNFKNNSLGKNLLQIAGHLVLSRTAIAIGGQAANLVVKGHLAPL